MESIAKHSGPIAAMGWHWGDYVRIKAPGVNYAGWLKVTRIRELHAWNEKRKAYEPSGYFLRLEEPPTRTGPCTAGTARRHYCHSRHVVDHAYQRPEKAEFLAGLEKRRATG